VGCASWAGAEAQVRMHECASWAGAEAKVCMHVCAHTCTHTQVHKPVQICVHTCTHTGAQIDARTHARMHAHTHARTQVLFYSRIFADLVGRFAPRRKALMVRSSTSLLIMALGKVRAAARCWLNALAMTLKPYQSDLFG